MPNRPLLLFPRPQPADRTKQGPFPPGKIRTPGLGQGRRLAPMREELQKAFDARRTGILRNTLGVDPEQALVLADFLMKVNLKKPMYNGGALTKCTFFFALGLNIPIQKKQHTPQRRNA